MASQEASVVDLDNCSVFLRDDGRAEVAGTSGHSTTKCADGTILVEPSGGVLASFGRASMVESSRHGGERHLDGDELVYLVSGAAAISLLAEDADVEERVDLGPGRVVIVPQGRWHRVLIDQPSELIFLTPGRTEVRPPLS